ncbi:MAG: AbrB/MazE/SpoVT family DNA-binding domain-containing protein [Oscillospiraceae bacterium]|nr:AbrB/MazE/SpoVT family DNA-binding domain-containing protein [Oscillospiraceae bacterium]
MRATGIVRKVDELGRIVLPVELRRSLDIGEKDELEIFLESERIVLQKKDDRCVFCGAVNHLTGFRDRFVCRECIEKLNNG